MGRKLSVEVCDANDLLPREGQESASPYCIIDYGGQRRKTEMRNEDPNPICNSKYEFVVCDPETMDTEVLEINVYSEKKSFLHLHSFLGRVRIPGYCFVKQGEEAIVYYPLRGRTIFSNVKGEMGVKVWYFDEPHDLYGPPILILCPPPPPTPFSVAAREEEMLMPEEEVDKPAMTESKAAPLVEDAMQDPILETPSPKASSEKVTDELKMEVKTPPCVLFESMPEMQILQKPVKPKKPEVQSYYSVPRRKKQETRRGEEQKVPLLPKKEEPALAFNPKGGPVSVRTHGEKKIMSSTPPQPDPPPAPPDDTPVPPKAPALVREDSPEITEKPKEERKSNGRELPMPAITEEPQEKSRNNGATLPAVPEASPKEKKKGKRVHWGTKQVEGEEEEEIRDDGLIVQLKEKGKKLHIDGKPKAQEEKEKAIKLNETKESSKQQEDDEREEDHKVKQQEPKKEREEEEEKFSEEERQQDPNAEAKRQREKSGRPIYDHPSIVDPADYALKEIELATPRPIGEKSATHDLVENMHYLFIRVVKARQLAEKDADGSPDAYVKISVGNQSVRTRAIHKSLNPSWNQVFAFGKDRIGGQNLEISTWAEDTVNRDEYLGSLSFELSEIPIRVQPDSPLAPQWYRLEETQEGHVKGDIMLAVWMGTQADEAFTEAWQSDSGDYANTRSKVYIAPKLWYIRSSVVEAQDVQPIDRLRLPELSVRAQLGFQILKTRYSQNRSTSPSWNEDLLFVAAEPFEDDLILTIEDRVSSTKEDQLGYVRIPLSSIERRVDARPIASRWFDVERIKNSKPVFNGRMHLRVCFEGGYHVMDEPISYISCVRPTAKQLWKPSIGRVELGVICANGLVPMKTKGGRGTTDAYCVAKYGQKWIRTRTIVDNFNPRWNEQYTWEVHDPCTVITVVVLDNWHLHYNPDEIDAAGNKDGRIGKVRIRLSTLERNRVYTIRYPLLMLQQLGVKKMGEIELAVRFSASSMLETFQIYSEPLLPKLHYSHPLGVAQTEKLRTAAMKVTSIRLSRSEPPLRQEVVQYVLEPDSTAWSLRRSRANYSRILNILSRPLAVISWFDNICKWKSGFKTVVIHILFCFLVCFPRFILPMLLVFFFLKGSSLYRFRGRSPPSIDAKLSQAEQVDPDELDEEFDPIPSTKDPEIIRARYDRLRVEAAKVQNILGDLATEGERVLALFNWRDPRATLISTAFWLPMAFILYILPIRLMVTLLGFYLMRHPNFRKPIPPVPLSFFKRMPSFKDQIL